MSRFILLAAGAAGAVAFLASDFQLFQLTNVLVFAIALLGLNLLVGYNGQISLGHGAFPRCTSRSPRSRSAPCCRAWRTTAHSSPGGAAPRAWRWRTARCRSACRSASTSGSTC